MRARMAQLSCFAEFSLDREAGILLRHGEPLAVRRKLWDALCLLVERRGSLVSLDDFRERVWRNVRVGDGSVGTLIYELRRLLNDSASEPRFIETLPMRGFRFIAAVTQRTTFPAEQRFVGRSDELRRLAEIWTRVRGGERQLVVVAGEPGIGKSELIRHFVKDLLASAKPAPRVLTGHCIERERGTEAYLPVLDILDAWHQSEDPADPSSLIALLRARAPRWLRQLPWAGGRRAVNALSAVEARPERVRREIASVFDAAAAQQPLILVFEDLHWADAATIELVRDLAVRTTQVPVLVLASTRQAEAAHEDHPVGRLRHVPRERLTVIEPRPFNRDEIRDCLGLVFPDAPDVISQHLESTLRQSGGNPLLVTALARLAIDRGIVTRTATGWRLDPIAASPAPPAEIKALLHQQLALLSPAERLLLEAAAVTGEEVDAAAIAGALGQDVEAVDTELRRLTLHSSLVHEVGVSSWPNGSTAGRFRFRHALYREILYHHLPAGRRAKLHRRVGEAIERGFAAAPQPVETILAEHFESGGDHERAAEYLERTALQMIARSATREAGDYFRRSLERTVLLPDGPPRWAREVRVRTGHGLAAALAYGLDAPAVAENYRAIDRLRRRLSDPEVLFPTLRVFWVFELLRFGYAPMQALDEQLREVAESSGSPAYRSLAASMSGTTQAFLGNLVPARRWLEASLRICDDPALLPAPQSWLVDPRVEARCILAWVLWLAGEHASSREVFAAAMRIAVDSGHESTRGLAIWFRSSLAQLDGDTATTRAAADDLQRLASESDLPAWLQIAAIVRALADLTEGDPAGLERGLESLAATEGNPTILIARAYLLGQLALAYGRQGESERGLALVDMALARIAKNGARVSESDLRRIRGELLAGAGAFHEADASFEEAIEVARHQGSRAFELRASAARVVVLAQQRSKRLAAARAELASICATFDEGVEVHDVRAARAVLSS